MEAASRLSGLSGLGFRVHGQGESSVACGLPSEKA